MSQRCQVLWAREALARDGLGSLEGGVRVETLDMLR